MKNIFLLSGGLMIMVLIIMYGTFQGPVTNFPSSNSGVVAFGDSLVEGKGSARGGGFVKILSEKFKTPITNLGRSGDTTAQALNRVSKVVELKPAVTILLLGGNDFLQGVSEPKIISNLSRIIEALHASGSTVIVVGLESDTLGNHHRQIFDGLVQKYNTAYVANVLHGIYGNGVFMSKDRIHPNDLGYELMANRIGLVLASLLTR